MFGFGAIFQILNLWRGIGSVIIGALDQARANDVAEICDKTWTEPKAKGGTRGKTWLMGHPSLASGSAISLYGSRLARVPASSIFHSTATATGSAAFGSGGTVGPEAIDQQPERHCSQCSGYRKNTNRRRPKVVRTFPDNIPCFNSFLTTIMHIVGIKASAVLR